MKTSYPFIKKVFKNSVHYIVCLILIISSCVSNTEPIPETKEEKDMDDDWLSDSLVLPDVEYDGKYTIEKKSFEYSKAENVIVDITVDYGKFTISGGSDNLVDAEFKYVEEELKPVMNYKERDDRGVLAIYMSKFHLNDDNEYKSENKAFCNLKLTNNIPLDVDLTFGAGKGEFDFEGMKLKSLNAKTGAGKFDFNLANTSVRRVNLDAGAGEADIDLTGKWRNNLNAEFTCGIGKITIRFPKDINIKVHTTGLLGAINARGFSKNKRDYSYTPKEDVDETLYVQVTGAIGEINLVLSE